MWVSQQQRRHASAELDAVTGVVVRTIALGGATDVAVGLGAVWVSDAANGRVLRINPQTDQVTAAINVGTGPSAIALGDGSVWVANSLDGTVSRIDPQTNQVTATIPVGNGPSAIAVGAGGVWVANEFGHSVVTDRLGDRRGRAHGHGRQQSPRPGGRGRPGMGERAGLRRKPPRRHADRAAKRAVRLARSDRSDRRRLRRSTRSYMTNDGLTAFKRVGGSDGAQVVPDLATSLPTPTDGGRTYTFQLRSGIRYSNGQPVRPEDFRRAIQRSLRLGWTIYYPNIVGGAACLARPTRCDLSRGIVTDDAANTVTFQLVRPDPEFLATAGAVARPRGARRDARPRHR